MSGSVYRSSSSSYITKTSNVARSPSMSYNSAGIVSMSIADLGGLTRLEVNNLRSVPPSQLLQDKIRLLQDDLESERELRNRIERERADLSVQLISLTDRLDDAEGSTDAQVRRRRWWRSGD